MTENQKMALMAVADHLEHQVTDAQFKMNEWMNSCGTVGCAVGHCIGLLPGLKLASRTKTGSTLYPRSLRTGRWDDEAIGDELGLTMTEVNWLFYPGSYHPRDPVTRHEVYTRIRAFAKGEVSP